MNMIAFLKADKSGCLKSGCSDFIPRKNDIVILDNKKYLVDEIVIEYDDKLKVKGIDVMCKEH
ncbi:hypothetical protein [Clostridium butyricum]|uniref:hypothetical protein n=1 Tax=Clostridium butyricum TaxID=1492 RepID=UPI00071E9FC1|nr:hypothetical protein [Clostridium butyricum]ALR90227.1 hypothetical protein ATN24_17335 [Clostridium butyricum]ALS19112.1 hypothetical protein ATD26_19790 [Clostridium butyricum]ANF16299.1 hypothetical protein AZ909_19825 [Clostridium butyricum]AOR96211.1 hypothetical protein BBB49_19295 [Clostridium butyricum]MCI3010246.1 hypothetical protein [Clostridium butyricum]